MPGRGKDERTKTACVGFRDRLTCRSEKAPKYCGGVREGRISVEVGMCGELALEQKVSGGTGNRVGVEK